ERSTPDNGVPLREPDLTGHPLLRLSHNPADVPSIGIEADRQVPLESIAVDTSRSLVHPDNAEIAERNEGPIAVPQSNVPDRLDVVSILFRKPHDQIEPSLLFIHPGGGLSTYCSGNDLSYIRHIDAVPCDLTPIDIDRDVGLAEELFDFEIFHTSNCAENAGDLITVLTQGFQIRPKQFDRNLGANPRNQFVHPLLDRLTDQIVGAGHPCQSLAHLLFQARHGGSCRPRVDRVQHRDRIAFVWFLRVVRQLRTSDLRHHHLYFGKLHDRLLHFFFDLDRLPQRNAR